MKANGRKGRRSRWGFTLLELIVAIVILGIAYGVAIVTIRIERGRASTTASSQVERLRRSAIHSATRITGRVEDRATVTSRNDVTANPDGSVVADSGLAIDRLTGRPFATGETTTARIARP